jgi:sugar/nucleoside kinase (ribokinase family)
VANGRRSRDLLLERLLEAGRALERVEAGRSLAVAGAAPAHRCERRGRADHTADEEGPESLASVVVVHATIVGVRICTLGDALLDVIVRLERPLAPGDDTVAETRTAPGGQAANVAAWAASLGVEARFVGRRGDDEAGRLVERALDARGVELLGPADGANGIVVSLVDPDGGRTMASDRGVAPSLAPDDLEPAWFDGCTWLHVAGYSLLRSPIDAASREAARFARERGARVSVDLSTWSAIRAFGAVEFTDAVAALEPDLVFGNEAELDELPELDAPTLVVKRGAKGFRVARNGQFENYTAAQVRVVDTTGAGDALAAGFLVGGPHLAAETAGRCVAKVGAMP